MITNEQYLIQKYAEAREKQNDYPFSDAGRLYWKGAMDTYHSLLTDSFSAWAEYGSAGYFVFYEGMTYDAALTAASMERDRSNHQAENTHPHFEGDIDFSFDH
jgi:hypothetical protein